MSVWSSLAPVVIGRCFYPFEIQCTYRTRMVLVMVQKQVVSFANGSWVKICKKKQRRRGDVRKKLRENIGKTTMGSENPIHFSPTFTGALLPRSLKWSMSNFKCLISAWNPSFNSSKLREFFKSSAVNWPVDPINEKQPKAVFPMLKTGSFSC